MKRAARNFLLLLCAGAAGFGASELLYRATLSRDAIGWLMSRGRFLALVRGRAIHERDLFQGGDAETMLAAAALRDSPRGTRVTENEVAGELELLREQFGDEEDFAAALASARLTEPSLRVLIVDHLAVRAALEEQIAPELGVTEEECRQFYESKRAQFELPPRFRASHIFVAAPEGTAPEIVAAKRNLIEGLSVRLLAGETMAKLAAEASEDEATKTRGGDLGYFSAWRMPPEFIAELEKLSLGATSAPLRSHLGFHLVQLTELKPARALAFEEVRAEIATQIANRKRTEAIASLDGMRKTPAALRPVSDRR